MERSEEKETDAIRTKGRRESTHRTVSKMDSPRLVLLLKP
jgi:hypothetical protein